MKYILCENIALRSWQKVPYAYYVKGCRDAQGLTGEEFRLLSFCDGSREIDDSPLLQRLVSQGYCRVAKEGERLTSWQKKKACDNRYFPAINWMITGKCNYNCRHCFNAADNNHLQSEFSSEEAEQLICDAEKCGINAFTITGGEPMIHPHFMDIIRSIYKHGMYVNELNTNGYFLTESILEEMKSIGCNPLMKISFDGIGHHDWLRNREGAETDAVRAIRLCVEKGFTVKAQTNVHRMNINTMLPTAEFLNETGVSEMRIIRTTESPRWIQNAGDACLTMEEYFDGMLKFLSEYTRTACDMELDIWQFVHVLPKAKTYSPRAIECPEGTFRDNLPVCRGNRGMVAIGANGNLYPCHQMSGYYEQHGWKMGNVKTDGLQKLLREGSYIETVCATVKDLAEHNSACSECQWFKYCCGGCRALGLAFTGDVFGPDPSKCLFFKSGYGEKLKQSLPDDYMP